MKILQGDCLEILPTIGSNWIDSVVTDPPYGLKFMGKEWDHSVPGEHFWREALRVAKPGAHLLAFGGTRTYHRLVCAIEDAGWEIRDTIAWVYGSGFPKSRDVSKAIDREAGADRKVVGRYKLPNGQEWNLRQADDGSQTHSPGAFTASGTRTLDVTAPATEEARKWSGWGTALKPAFEPIVMARKPLAVTVVQNVQEYGTGALNIDACRIKVNPLVDDPRLGGKGSWSTESAAKHVYEGGYAGDRVASSPLGRWPANFVHDGSEEVVGMFPKTNVTKPHPVISKIKKYDGYGNITQKNGEVINYEEGIEPQSAARFFYTAKASASERNSHAQNRHPTVKPISLMRWLCRLVTPPGGTILDPFMGSGSTGIAAKREGFDFIGIELDPHWCEVAKRRIGMAAHQKNLFSEVNE